VRVEKIYGKHPRPAELSTARRVLDSGSSPSTNSSCRTFSAASGPLKTPEAAVFLCRAEDWRGGELPC
jgi:hypothetical protein